MSESKPEPEIRGGDRPADFIQDDFRYEVHGKNWTDSIPVAHEDSELEDGAESYGDSEIENSE